MPKSTRQCAIFEPAGASRARPFASMVTLLFATAVVAGCPYEGEIPLGEPDPAAFENALLGTWRLEEVPDSRAERSEVDCEDGISTVHIMRFNAAEYLMAGLEESCPPTYMRAFITRLDNAVFLNLNEVHSNRTDPHGTVRYFVARMRAGADTIRLRLLNESLKHVSSPAAFRDSLRNRVNDPALYDNPVDFLLIRMRPAGAETIFEPTAGRSGDGVDGREIGS